MPPPGEIEFRLSSSPVPAHTCSVSLGAMASSPMLTTFSWSNTGRKLVPELVVFQIPPAAAATKKVCEGLGMPTMLDTRPPMFAGPMLRQRKAESVAESTVEGVWARAGSAHAQTHTIARAIRRGVMALLGAEGCRMRPTGLLLIIKIQRTERRRWDRLGA